MALADVPAWVERMFLVGLFILVSIVFLLSLSLTIYSAALGEWRGFAEFAIVAALFSPIVPYIYRLAKNRRRGSTGS